MYAHAFVNGGNNVLLGGAGRPLRACLTDFQHTFSVSAVRSTPLSNLSEICSVQGLLHYCVCDALSYLFLLFDWKHVDQNGDHPVLLMMT